MENKKWFAVQIGDNFDWDDGSYNYDEAVERAKEYAEDPKNEGLEIRIAVIEEGNDPICIDEVVIVEGER